jgi:hypothetical protein
MDDMCSSTRTAQVRPTRALQSARIGWNALRDDLLAIRREGVEKDELILTSERGRIYRLNLRTRAVYRVKPNKPNPTMIRTGSATNAWGEFRLPSALSVGYLYR